MREKYIIDVPIYRQKAEVFHKDVAASTEARLTELFEDQGLDRTRAPNSVANVTDRIWRENHAPWRFNQIVGWVRVYVLGDSIRGESWWTVEKFVRRRPVKRRIEFFGKAFDLTFRNNESDGVIAAAVRRGLTGCVRDFPRRGLGIDLEVFDNIALVFPWRRILNDSAGATEQSVAV